jgi:octaprenyl-diphosphate synthase
MFDEIVRDVRPELSHMYALMDETLSSRVPLANQVVDYFRDRKGKGVRPLMTLLAAKLVAGRVTDASYDGAVALELVHNASLMHDDVVDESDRRRGASTINCQWGNKVAVLMGDYFLSKSLLRIHASGSLDVLNVLAEMVTRLSEGELAQLSGAHARTIDEAAYFRIIADKTASMFAACMKIGALSVGATPIEVCTLTEIGEEMGLIFQMRDDLFDYLPSAEMGKPSGHDIREGKVTLPLIYAFRTADAAIGEPMLHLLEASDSLTDQQVATLVDFAISTGGIDYTRNLMQQKADSVCARLNTFPDSEPKQALLLLVDYFMQRRS